MNAQQFLAEFGHIANAPGGVHELRGMILQLAITGGLSSPIESDGNVTQQLGSCRSRIEGAVKDKTYKRIPPSEFSTKAFLLNSIPSHWTWAKLGDISHQITDGTHKTPQYRSQGVVFLSIKNISSGTLDLTDIKYISEEEHLEINSRCNPQKGDILFCRIGTLGRPYIVDMEFPFSIFVSLGLIKFDQEFVLPQYLKLVLESPHMLNQYELVKAGGAHTNKLNLKVMPGLPIPLPPTEEQFRIVAKVGELMALCDQLEAQQQKRRTLQNHLRQATLQAVAASQSPHELQESWQRLQAHFGQLFSAPEDASDLRQAVLDLAVSGRLSEFSESDEPSKVLKGKILSAKELGISTGSFSRKKQVKPEVLEETVLPSHWETITLDEAISKIDAGWSPACLPNARADENKWGVLKTTSVQVLRFLPSEHKELPVSLDPRPQYQIQVGDILITRAGPKNRVGICCVVDDAPAKLMISDKLIRFHIVNGLINPNFVALCLSAGEPGRIVERLKSGMASSQMNISQNKLRSITIPLPPIEEQLRILEKVDSFMDVVNGYSEKLHAISNVAEQVATATISTLTGIAIEQEEEPMKAPQTELVALVRLGTPPNVKAQAPLATILARYNGEMSAKDLWQRFGGEIDAFYAQLKAEVAHGWILEPEKAEMLEKIEE
ncbi:hypothetical protein AUR67_14185 [Pseudoalteromonas sp. XI10]|uniref:restriction endonuclease subunit S n=1 Tax=Pseudoalteromonas sp. XI10 TaxID=1766621 RepID=UPI0007337F84|nr:restriction endonuclease subunit S [Pseudoalteromonas sp. XI10]KTG19676.1 hypothetical protein AUR67_14185 [Pseudoalteromonas sp. XI10]